MFRKITSNRPPGTTVWSEFHKEFGRYIDVVSGRAKRFLESRPLSVFLAMVTAIAVSLGCSLFVPKKPPQKDTVRISVQRPIMEGMGGIVSTVSALRELLEINSVLDGLLEKDSLESADSLIMGRAIDRIQLLEKQLGQAAKHQNSP